MLSRDFSFKVREGRRPGIATDSEHCEANIAEVMLIVQVSVCEPA